MFNSNRLLWLLFLLGSFSLLAMEKIDYNEHLKRAGFDPNSPTTIRILQAIKDTEDEAIRKNLFGSPEELSAVIEQNAQEISIVPTDKKQQDRLLSEALTVCFEALQVICTDKKFKKLDLKGIISESVFYLPFDIDLTEKIFGLLTPINLTIITSGKNADLKKLLKDYIDILVLVYEDGSKRADELQYGIKKLNKLSNKNNKLRSSKK